MPYELKHFEDGLQDRWCCVECGCQYSEKPASDKVCGYCHSNVIQEICGDFVYPLIPAKPTIEKIEIKTIEDIKKYHPQFREYDSNDPTKLRDFWPLYLPGGRSFDIVNCVFKIYGDYYVKYPHETYYKKCEDEYVSREIRCTCLNGLFKVYDHGGYGCIFYCEVCHEKHYIGE